MSRKGSKRLLLIVALAAVTLLACRSQAPQTGVIPNAAFETVADGAPMGWTAQTWGGEGTLLPSDEGHDGSRCVMIRSEQGGDLGWTTELTVRPFSKYRFTGWIRTQDVDAASGMGALINLYSVSSGRTEPVIGTTDWTPVALEFDTGRNDVIQVHCLLGGWGLSKGTVWFDDLALELLSSKTLEPSLAVDGAETGEPISPYIYGQFIEHLGRCIYGGIWAEMLEDRKFYYPVTDHYAPWGEKDDPYWKAGVFRHLAASPWRVVGSSGTVTMDSVQAFVGEHSVSVQLGGGTLRGIEQEGVTLQKGRAYEGRLILAADGDASAVLRLTGPDGTLMEQPLPALSADFDTYTFNFIIPKDCENARFQILGRGRGHLRIGTASLMPSDNVQGFRTDVLALLRELDSPIYRWPGGNFVSGYNWRDGIGPRDQRPPRKNPAWTGVEHNDVGIHEYMDLMGLIGAEPFIAVNTGLGSVEEVAQEVEYCVGPADSPLGRLRAANGHPNPYQVSYWAVGNEMYGDWQLGHMPLEEYVKKHNRVAEAMRRIDPAIQLVGVGAVGPWSETMLKVCGDNMDLISEHIYAQERPGVLGHSAWLAQMIDSRARSHRQYRETIPGLAEKDIRIAMDEWNYWYGDYLYGELGTRYFLKDGLGVASGLHAYFRHSDLYFMANYAQAVNVIGAIKTTPTDAALEVTGLVLKLYRQHFGSIPIALGGAPEPLDVSAAWTEDRSAVTLAVVNPTREAVDLPVQWGNIPLTGTGTRHRLQGRNPGDYNAPGEKPRLQIQSQDVSVNSTFTAPPLSVTLWVLPVQAP